MLSEVVEVKNARYYQIFNRHFHKVLYLTSGSDDFKGEKVFLNDSNEKSLGQAWQIFRVDSSGSRRPNCFEFVHARSTLVLTTLKDQFSLKMFFNKSENKEMRLRYGKWLDTQLFYLEKVDEKNFPNIYRFLSYDKAEKPEYIYYDKILKCDSINPQDKRCHWEVKACYDNDIINRSCYLENAFSGLVADVPGGSTKDGCKLIQYHLNNRFNQRFNIYKAGKYFKIGNLNSRLFLTSHKGKKATHLSEVFQDKQVDEMFQMWIIEYHGKSLFNIRSAENQNLSLGIKDNSVKPEDQLVLTTNEDYALWKIIGFIPR